MGFTIDDALREFKKNYKMTLLAGVRSSKGPEILLRYRCTCPGQQ